MPTSTIVVPATVVRSRVMAPLARGEATIVRPLSSSVLTFALVALTAATGCFIWFGQYARKESVSGYLEPAVGVVRVFAPKRGVIRALLVTDGDTVEPGTMLFKVATPQTLADGADAHGERLADIGARRKSLERSRQRTLDRAEADATRLGAEFAALTEQRAALRTQADIALETTGLSARQLDALKTLYERGALPALKWWSARAEDLARRERLQATRERLGRLDGQLAVLGAARKTLDYDTASAVADIDAALLALHGRAIDAESAADFAVRAPIGGRVTAITRRVGETATPANAVLTIVPVRTPLVARLLIPTRAIGFVAAGQTVRLRFDAFPYQHFGTLPGRLDHVADTVLFHGDSLGPLPVAQPAYPATVILAAQAIDANGRRLPLQSGMQLEADILLEKRSILAWLAEPLLGLRGRTR
jgi:membrane fusion protein